MYKEKGKGKRELERKNVIKGKGQEVVMKDTRIEVKKARELRRSDEGLGRDEGGEKNEKSSRRKTRGGIKA